MMTDCLENIPVALMFAAQNHHFLLNEKMTKYFQSYRLFLSLHKVLLDYTQKTL